MRGAILYLCVSQLALACIGEQSPPDAQDGGLATLNDGGDPTSDGGPSTVCSNDVPYEGCSVVCDGGQCDPTNADLYFAWNCFIEDESNFSCSADAECTVVRAPWFECDGTLSGLFEKSGLPVRLSAAPRARELVARYTSGECFAFSQAYGPSKNEADGAEGSRARCRVRDGETVGTCEISQYNVCGGCRGFCDGGA